VPSGDPGRAFGASTQPEDYPVIAQAVVEDLNERGGVAGRPVEAEIREASQEDQSQETQTRQAEEICESLANDAKVDLVAAAGNSGAFFGAPCYASHGLPLLIPGFTIADETMQKFAPWLLPATGANLTTVAAELPGQLAKQGVLSKKIGILAFEVPDVRRAVEETFKPAIERNGGEVLETVYMQVAYQDVGAQVSSAVLRFKSLEIDLVLPSFAVGGGVTGIFMHEAETQGYRPRYGLSSLDAPIIVDATLNAPESQLRNAVGVGYDPSRDVPQNQLAPSRNERRCWDMVNKRLGTRYSDRTAGGGNGFAALEMCELVWQLEAALAPWEGRTFDPGAVRGAIEALGTSYTPVRLPAARFGPGRSDGAAVQRAFRFDAPGCGCFTYQGRWVPIRS
jgi:ABC-type branched-subunit amino acid transport system substrate-binding protein